MSLIPEFIFRSVIARGIRTIREDTRLLDQLFRNLDQQSAKEMRNFIIDNRIYLDINYPREALKLPAIIILLRSETEGQAWLGDSMGVSNVPDEMTFDSFDNEPLEVLGGTSAMSTLSGEGPLVFGPFQALSGTNNTLKIATKEWASDQFKVGDHQIFIIGGLGAGQKRDISANGQDTILISKNWAIVPDATSTFTIRSLPAEIVGEPRSIYTRENISNIERLGSLYNLSYQIQVIAPNPELAVYLHAIVKAIFTLGRTFMEGQGIINMKMGATDFVPRSEYQPDHAYMRALNVDFQHHFDIFSELPDLATSLRVVLENLDPKGLAVNVSDTSC